MGTTKSVKVFECHVHRPRYDPRYVYANVPPLQKSSVTNGKKLQGIDCIYTGAINVKYTCSADYELGEI